METPGVRGEDGVFASAFDADPRLRSLLGPGGPFEVETIELDGARVRSFVRAPATILDCFQLARAHAEKVHIVHGDERLTHAEVRRQALAVARRLRADHGVGPGDRVALAMRNLPEFFTAFWATVALGAVVVPLNAWWTGPELRYAVEDSGAKAVFADHDRVERLGAEPLPAAIVGVRVGQGLTGDFVRYQDLIGAGPLDDAELALRGPDDVVTILYTSGTTGRPKGAPSTNRGTVASLMNMAFSTIREAVITGRRPGPPLQPCTMMVAPLFRVGGIAAVVGGSMGGAKVLLLGKWDVEAGIALAEREGVTSFGGVPAIAREILEHPQAGRLAAHVGGFPMGGAAVPPDLPRRAVDVFGPGVQILNGYGLTETTSAVVTNVGVEYAANPGSVGRPNLTADLKVEGPDGALLRTGEIGELCFRSPQLAKGYWNDPQATAASFVDGWFHSGDLGYVDAEGFVYVVDRIKDVVIRGGENVYCAEVEAVLFEHPGVADVAVVGLPEPKLGERVCAVLVPRPGADFRLEEVREFAGARLASFKCPEALHVLPDVPRTATGKTEKRELRKILAAAGDAVQRSW